jgi:hypothetical protein
MINPVFLDNPWMKTEDIGIIWINAGLHPVCAFVTDIRQIHPDKKELLDALIADVRKAGLPE